MNQTHLSLSEIGYRLESMVSLGDLEKLYFEFARHILLNLRGLDLISCAEDIDISGQRPTKARIIKELGHRGIYHPPNGTHANGMRQWLEMAGLVDKNKWVAKPEKLQEILGNIDNNDLDLYSGLNNEQIAFAKAFARLNIEESRSNDVARYATELYGVEFPEGGLPQSTLFPLRDAGLLECEKTTSGQGAKPYIIRPTEKLRNEVIEPILAFIEESVSIQHRKLIRKPYEEILRELKDPSKHIKGLALEALAFYLGRLLDLDFVKWRLRSNMTGGAELDVIMEGTHLIFSRWQIQCKNSRQARLDDIAKEVGIAQVIKSNVIMIVTTGKIGTKARDFAKSVMKETSLHIILLSNRELDEIKKSPASIVNVLNNQARNAMKLKRFQLEEE